MLLLPSNLLLASRDKADGLLPSTTSLFCRDSGQVAAASSSFVVSVAWVVVVWSCCWVVVLQVVVVSVVSWSCVVSVSRPSVWIAVSGDILGANSRNTNDGQDGKERLEKISGR